jgi:hypothetical protein
VIVRVSRARIKPGMDEQVFALLKKRTDDGGKPPLGQRGVLIATRQADDPSGTEIFALTLWEDEDSMAAALGPDWRRAVTFASFQELLTDAESQHYETLATRWEELTHLAD